MTLIEANAKLINAGFSRIHGNMYIKGDVEFTLTEVSMHDLPIETIGEVTFETTAWAADDYRMQSILEDGMNDRNLSYSQHDMSNHGWVKVGTAVITVTPATRDDMILANVDALKKQIQNIQFEAQMEVNKLQGKIQNLLAITYDKTTEA